MTLLCDNPRHFRQDPKEPAFYNDPYALYRELQLLGGPVFWEDYGFWCLTEFSAVNNALRDRRFARLAPAAAPSGTKHTSYASHLDDFAAVEAWSLLALEPPDHTRLRQRVNRAFITRQVERMAADIEQLANAAIDRFATDRQVDLLTHYATPIPVTVIARLLGVPDEETDQLLAWSHAMVRVYTLTQTVAEEHAANTAAAEFRDRLLQLIQQRRHNPKDDLLSHLVAKHPDNEPLRDEEIVSIAVLLLNAGHEATVHQMGNAVYAILRQQQPAAEWFKTTALADATVSEAMRYDAPLHLFTRYAQEDVELHADIRIAKGEQVALLLGAANRDPSRFTRADTFDPERTDGGHVSLGAGLHFCVGAALAKLELRIALTTLFSRLPSLALEEPVEYQDSFHFHGLRSLQVCW